ncbi:MAG: trehalose-6-phosphate synthase [Candidatus Omnitrophica bacterium]|nr:trehalose-6-phosphate synthase [Candidatus Omnitrophota bacterium]
MRITLRLIASLVIVAASVSFIFSGLQARQEQAHLEQELSRRAAVLAESLQESVEPLLDGGKLDGLHRLVERFADRERLAGVAIYRGDRQPMAMSPRLPVEFQIAPETARQALDGGGAVAGFLTLQGQRWHLQAVPVRAPAGPPGALVLFHNADYIEARGAAVWRHNFLRLLLHVLLISLTTLLIVRWYLTRPMAKTVEWLRRLRIGEPADQGALPHEGLFGPLAREVTHITKTLTVARAAAEEEARLRHTGASRWTPERLKEHLRTTLEGRPLLVIANREPYMHVRQGRQVRWIMPASGLVTAMEPILRACGGTWIAHGAGDADRETADGSGKLRVPPDEPMYTLRRVWLEKQEEDGYYYGFANEGLWPLCHIAHTRPLFRAEDWRHYRQVNMTFAQAAVEEMRGMERPYLLIQDYHFALLPRLIREKRPDARVALFWHIPWPNPEAFGICPWARELLHGMLGADLLGFHTQYHCNNFLDTVDQTLESRIDWEQFAVNRAGHTTWVKPFPISIPVEEPPGGEGPAADAAVAKEAVLKELGLQTRWLGVGVDRIDYTKGIAERFRAIERFLEHYPEFQGQFVFVELGAPSRTLIPRYHELGAELDAEAERINRRFQTRAWKPIVFLQRHHSHEAIQPYYRAADVCVVTSLHDGMNLVAKEYVAARADARGVLVLSRFAGASRELRDALLVNPYDVEQVAAALHAALTMTPEEQTERMTRMRELLRERNIYRWAADLVAELARLRPVRERLTNQG